MYVALIVNYNITGSIVITKYFKFFLEQGMVHSTKLPTFSPFGSLSIPCDSVPHPIDVQLVKLQDGVIT